MGCSSCNMTAEEKAAQKAEIARRQAEREADIASGKLVVGQRPSLARKAVNAVKHGAQIVASGLEFAPKDVRDHRMDICIACDRRDRETQECLECGCPVQRKTQFMVMECELGKWDK